MSDLEIYRRNLPHWRLDGAVYFLTWRLHPDQPALMPEERDILVSTLLHFAGQRYALAGFVIMDDHAHALAQPIGGHRLQDILHAWKSFSANALQRKFGRKGAIWQAESFDRIVRDDAELLEKLQYMQNNPFKRWPEITGYRWVSVNGGEMG